MADVRKYWNRIGYVSIEGPDGKMHDYGNDENALDFKFDVLRVAGDVYVNFTVSILGLSLETIKFLTAWNIAETMKNPRKIEVYAGYEYGSKAGLIAKGYIIHAMPTNPPEMWLNMQCLNIANKRSKLVTAGDLNIKTNGVKFKDLFESVASHLGYSPVWKLSKEFGEQKLKVPKFACNEADLIKKTASILGVVITVEGDLMTAWEPRGWESAVKSANPVSIETGLIGIAKLDVAGAVLRVRMNDNLPIMSWIKLESKMVPSANGYYYILTKRDVGHLRGDDWYTELQVLRKVDKKGDGK